MSRGTRHRGRTERSASASSGREPSRADVVREIDALVDECRDRDLWFVRAGYYPSADDERMRLLETIQKHADLARFTRAARLKAWLSRHSSSASAGS